MNFDGKSEPEDIFTITGIEYWPTCASFGTSIVNGAGAIPKKGDDVEDMFDDVEDMFDELLGLKVTLIPE
jgi:hypothetical protein